MITTVKLSNISMSLQNNYLLYVSGKSPSEDLSEVAQLCLTLCDPLDYSLPGSSVRGIFQARVLEWGAIAFPDISPPEISFVFSSHFHRESESEVAQSCPTLCDPMDCSLPGSSVHGILQAIVLEWTAIPSSGVFPTQGSNPGLLHCRQTLYRLSHQGA